MGIIDYKGGQVFSPSPSGDGGKFVNDNLINIFDRLDSVESTGGATVAPLVKIIETDPIGTIHFENRPSGYSVVMYKYSHYKSSVHIKGYKRSKTYNTVAATNAEIDINADFTSLDGHTFVAEDDNRYVLIKNQPTLSENGIYQTHWTGSACQFIFKKDTSHKMAVYVVGGAQADSIWLIPRQ